jgi:membrane fusion protein (multidrug efflux system)
MANEDTIDDKADGQPKPTSDTDNLHGSKDDATHGGDRTGADKKGGEGDRPDDEDKPKKGLREHPLLLIGAAIALVVVIIVALLWWLNARHYENTDDAFVDTHIVRLAPQIAGRVTRVFVQDNQLVRQGDPIADIDSADVQTRVAQAQAQKSQAQAQVDNALAQIRVSQASYQQAQADLASSQAQADNAAIDLARYKRLLALNPLAVAQQQFDQAVTAARQTSAQRDSAAQAVRTRAAQVAAARTQVTAGQDQVRAAQSQLDEANVNFGYTHIVAPLDGHVAQKTVAVGNYVEPGTQMLAIVPVQLWITANFKETQLDHMRPGQPVTVKVDACPSSKIRGHVDSIQRGAGQAFGILPPENATGNYVKVVQRVPVKIVIDSAPPECPLGPGISVEPTVRVR